MLAFCYSWHQMCTNAVGNMMYALRLGLAPKQSHYLRHSTEELLCTSLVCEFRSLAVCSVHTVAIPPWRKWRQSLGLMGLSSMVSGSASTLEGLATPFLSLRCMLLSCASTYAWLFVRTADCLHVENLRDPHLFVWCSFQSYACTFVRFVSSSEARHVQCPVMLPIITIMSVISISVQWNSTFSDIQCSIS